ncbi:MAG: formylglycine-generating enzyme family protein [Verrucomicrobiota bacterium]|nr:formylglycine-generating enzyme family protein [Verrucomicrobiota bacterium]
MVLDIDNLPDFPTDPRKWEGWRKYEAANPYDRLCLDPRAGVTDEQIQQHCTALLQWWQKKLPLRSQPSNPLTQLLGRGLDEASRLLVEARTQLLDPTRRREVDRELAAQAAQHALAEFAKYVAFSIKDGVLTADAEANLTEYGQRSGISDEQIKACIEIELQTKKARRVAAHEHRPAEQINVAAEKEFLRIVGLSDVNMGSATDSVRMLFNNIAHNLGIGPERAEAVLDDYLDKEELLLNRTRMSNRPPSAQARQTPAATPPPSPVVRIATPQRAANHFVSSAGSEMVLIASGAFVMGSDARDAAPNEQPLTPVKLSAYYVSKHPITNAQYEQFDPEHRQKRMPGATDRHPVVYVTSFEAVKFCQWLSQHEGKKYRLPSEAEWEYAARGPDNWKYPWGNNDKAIDVANFADASTSFPWRDPVRHDGFPESSPVGSFPRGASIFGIEDMAGNVWEWCLDFFQPLAGAPRFDPRGATAGPQRIYRGGSWKSRFSNLRASARSSNAPNYSCNDLGFRIVCECARAESR